MRRSKPTTLPLGTISEGTLRSEDLIPAYLDALAKIRLSRAERATVRQVSRDWDHAECNTDGPGTFADEDLPDLVTDLEEILENHTPDYAYFGSLEGDGACFGVWTRDLDDLEPDEVFRSDMTPGELRAAAVHGEANGVMYSSLQRQAFNRKWHEIKRTFAYWLYVNDHGNATLYRRAGNRWIEVWSAV